MHYLVTRSGGAPRIDDPFDQFSGSMFFQLWQVRSDPYSVLADGDTLWWVDQSSREVRWQLTVRNLRRSQCASIDSAREYLRRWFGVFPGDLSGYKSDGSFRNGWLLAWENEVVGPVGVVLPAGTRLGRNGFRRLTDTERSGLGLRPRRGKPLRPVEPLEEQGLLAPPRARAIPVEIARQVWQRDGRCCRQCGTGEGSFHLDHVYPWSKGGPNTLGNLQVLCAPCNLAKAAKVEGDLRPAVPGLPELSEMAKRLRKPVPGTADDLRRLIGAAARSEPLHAVVDLVLRIVTNDDANADSIVAAIESLRGLNEELDLWARAIYGIALADIDSGLLKLAGHDSDLGAAAGVHALLNLELDATTRKAYASRAAKCSFDTIAAMGHYELAMASRSGQTAAKHLQAAFQLGSSAVAADAALAIGVLHSDSQTAIGYLLHAARAKDSEVAAAACEAMANRFPKEPEISTYYLQKADELRTR